MGHYPASIRKKFKNEENTLGNLSRRRIGQERAMHMMTTVTNWSCQLGNRPIESWTALPEIPSMLRVSTFGRHWAFLTDSRVSLFGSIGGHIGLHILDHGDLLLDG